MLPRTRCLVILTLVIASCLLPISLFAANHYIVAGGTGAQNGTDWNNAFPDIPNSLIRGDTYFIAGSNLSYNRHVFGDPESGTLVITIIKATDANHGTDVGYLSSYGSLNAQWKTIPAGSDTWEFHTGYYTFDGAYGSGESPGGYGFQFKAPGTNIYQGGFINMGHGNATLSNLTFRHLEIDNGACCGVIPDTSSGSDAFEFVPGITNTNFLCSFCFIHDLSSTPFQISCAPATCNNIVIEQSVIARNRSTPTQHASAIAANQVNNFMSRYNVWEDIQGTGILVALNFLNQTWSFLGDRMIATSACPASCGYGSGAINDNNGSGILQNLSVFNTTFAGWQSGSNVGIGLANASSTGAVVENNLFWNISTACCSVNFPEGIHGFHDYNTILNAKISSANSLNIHEVQIISGATDPFVNDAANDFHLVAHTTTGISLTAPFTTQDPDGTLRGTGGIWDRGAFQFVGATQPAAPTNLTVVVH